MEDDKEFELKFDENVVENEIEIDDPINLLLYILEFDTEKDSILENGNVRRTIKSSNVQDTEISGYIDFKDDLKTLDGELIIHLTETVNDKVVNMKYDINFMDNKRNGRCKLVNIVEGKDDEIVEDAFYIQNDLITDYKKA